MEFLLLPNRQVARLVVGVPEGHQHIRARLETAAGDVVTLQESTLAALVRAYTSIATHPTRRAIELRGVQGEALKAGFDPVQLLETDADEGALCAELAAAPPRPGSEPTEVPTTVQGPSDGTDDLELDLEDLIDEA